MDKDPCRVKGGMVGGREGWRDGGRENMKDRGMLDREGRWMRILVE